MAADQRADSGTRRRHKGRSPSYPGISLRAAVERARAIYENEGGHEAPVSAIAQHWGFTSATTGPASVTFAALGKFGLLGRAGTGTEQMARLTPLALDILMNPQPLTAIQKAALFPPIHWDLWHQYGNDLPSDEKLRHRIVTQGGFTETGYQEFIRQYRHTIAYAQLSSAGRLDGETGPSGGQVHEHGMAQTSPPAASTGPQQRPVGGVIGNVLRIPIPLVGGKPVMIEGEFPISEAAWTQFIAVLNAMKPGLVRNPEPDDPGQDEA